MWKIKSLVAAALVAITASAAFAQTNPNLRQGQVLTPAQWNQLFVNKQDTLGYTPINKAGDQMLGRLVTAAPGSSTAGLNLTPGTTPGSPSNGDLWITSSAIFARVNGVSYNLLVPTSPCSVCAVTNATNTFTANQIININGGATPTAQSGMVLQLVATNSALGRLEIDTYANFAVLTGVRANGTLASPTTLVADDQILSLNAWGYDGTTRAGPYAALRLFSGGTWTATSHPTYLDFATTDSTASAAMTSRMRIEATGTITINGGTALQTGSISTATTTNNSLEYRAVNSSAGTSATAQMTLGNGTGNAIVGIGGTGFTGAAAFQNRMFISTASTGGMLLYTTGALPIDFYVNGTRAGGFGSTGLFTLVSPLDVPSGGTGRATLTSNAFLTGNGTGTVNMVAITGLVLGNGASAPSAYAGTSCTNQFPTALSAAGAATCSSVTNAFLTAGSFTNITGVGTLTAGATGAGFTIALTTSTVTGTLPAANFGALTGDVTNSAGSYATTIANNAVTNAKLATAAAYTLKGNFTGSTAVPTDTAIGSLTQKVSPAAGDLIMLVDVTASNQMKYATVSSVASAGSVSSIAGNTGAFTLANGIDNSGNQIQLTAARRTLPTTQTFTTGTNATYTTPANVLWIEVYLYGAGGPGGGGGNATPGTTGGSTCWKTSGTACTSPDSSASGGTGASHTTPGAGGTTTGTCNLQNKPGMAGGAGTSSNATFNGIGGTGAGKGSGIGNYGAAGANAFGNKGAGGGGGGSVSATPTLSGGGGGEGAECAFIINNPAATYVFTVGAGQTGPSGSSGGGAGGNSANGGIVVIEHYGS